MMTPPAALDAIAVLNRALAADPNAINALMLAQVECNDHLADDPSVQVGPSYYDEDGIYDPVDQASARPLARSASSTVSSGPTTAAGGGPDGRFADCGWTDKDAEP